MRPIKARIVYNRRVSEGHYILRLEAPAIARASKPGQFIQLQIEDSDPLLPRPFSFLDTSAKHLDLLYKVVGRGTEILSHKPAGDALGILGPLGNGWQTGKAKEWLLVGGGVGIPPLFHLAKVAVGKSKAASKNIRAYLGGRTQAFLHCEKEFRAMGVTTLSATEDGSKGHKGFVTQILEKDLMKLGNSAKTTQIFTCGPTPMLKAVSALAKKYGVACQISVEEPMACGFGVCLGCAVKVTTSLRGAQRAPKQSHDTCPTGEFRYAMACTEGPVFDAEKILWQ